ncbi:Cytidylate kinase [bioreactor metagenome]|uniref:(d)CMP kinase n=1 Tax=bioreactor metagenome TaxID=1076179 RepID=A0A645BML5_9ZZZZ
MENFAIAIDGPAGSGKSTVAKIIAEKLGIIYVDTGAMYRAVALFCIRNGVDTTDEMAVNMLLPKIQIRIVLERGMQKIFLADEDVTGIIRTQEVGQGASDVGLILSVREKLVEIQRDLAKGASVIMDGRDIGTNVLTNAQVKIYLNASVEERAKRRLGELEGNGIKADLKEVMNQIISRDKNDRTREHNPLKKASDAIEVDTTNMDIDQVVNEVIKIKEEKLMEA